MLYYADSVTDEPTPLNELRGRIHGRNRMACRECTELLNPAAEKSISTDEQRPDLCLHQAREGGVDFAVSTCFQYLDLYPDDRSRRQHVSRRQLKYRIVWIFEKADGRSVGHQLMQQRESLCPEFRSERVDAC